MKFTVERAALVKMLELVGKKSPGKKRREQEVRLSACAARVFVEANETVAGIEALVLADGTCLLPREVFLKLLKSYAPKPHIAMEADARAIRFCSTTLPVVSYSRVATPPGTFQIFPVTDVGVLQSKTDALPVAQSPVAPPSAPLPAVCSLPGYFPIAEDEMEFIAELTRLTRRVCALPTVTPQQLVGLAHALFALGQLPRISKGIYVEFCLGTRIGNDNDYLDVSATYSITEVAFEISTVFALRDPDAGVDTCSTPVYQVEDSGFRSLSPGDAKTREVLHDWVKEFDQMLNENPPEELRLYVTDNSAAGCMTRKGDG